MAKFLTKKPRNFSALSMPKVDESVPITSTSSIKIFVVSPYAS